MLSKPNTNALPRRKRYPTVRIDADLQSVTAVRLDQKQQKPKRALRSRLNPLHPWPKQETVTGNDWFPESIYFHEIYLRNIPY
jgi:hypothetical protein